MSKLVELEKQTKRFIDWLEKHKLSTISPIQENEIILAKLLSLCFDEPKDPLSLQACWLLEKYVKACPEHGDLILPHVVAQIEHVRMEGSQRILGNILIDTLKKQNNYDLSDQEEEVVIEIAFNWLITPGKAVAVVANCFEVLSYLSNKHPWIRDELIAQINYHMINGTAAIQARGKKILKKLKKNT